MFVPMFCFFLVAVLRVQIPSLPPASASQAFARAKEREKARAQAATAVMAGAENGGGEDDMGRALAAGGSGSGGAAVATVLGHGPQTPMRQVGDGVLQACPCTFPML